MKRNTPEHPKMKRLAKLMAIPLSHAVGLVEKLFHSTAKHAIHGDIGKYDDDTISDCCGWEGEATRFVNALVESRWLDKCEVNRFIVHDWHEHCDDAVKKAVSRSDKPFCKPVLEVADKTRTTADIGSLPLPSQAIAQPLPEPLPLPLGGSIASEALESFPGEARQPALQSAIAYQTRRYGGPNPGATWYRDLLHEAGAVFEVQADPVQALEVFMTACRAPPTKDLPRNASYSRICEYCGLKKPRHETNGKPWEKPKLKGEALKKYIEEKLGTT